MSAEAQSTLNVFVKARALIEKPENWAQGSQVGICSPPYCVSTANREASKNEAGEPNMLAWEYCNRAIKTAVGFPPVLAVRWWNDAPERTHAEVLAAFDKAIAAERAKLEAEAV